ncbi:MAG: hypothetical protein K0U38_06375 [Epsilonproteobacteria bacterium]|nr:hypothetical protein [Campylobacterota bacterium]
MQTMNLQIEESFFPHFKALIDSFINDNKVKIVHDELPKHLTCSSIEEVRRRVYLAEKEDGISEEEYNKLMNKFFKEEIGIER